MLVLSLDTSTRAGSCALMRDDRVLHEQPSDTSREQAERLPGELAALLERESVALADIDAFAVATGPGSFTGLRVGIATMQGLALAMAKPLIGISAFEALVARVDMTRKVDADREDPRRTSAWIDAWRGEVFAAMYENGRQVGTSTVAQPDDLLAHLNGQAILFIGDGAARYQELIRARLGDAARFVNPVAPLLAGAIATLAGDAFRAGQRPLPHAIRPVYVRRSDAELAREVGRT